MTEPRRPAAFRLEPVEPVAAPEPRKPRAVRPTASDIVLTELPDVFAEPDEALRAPPVPAPRRKRFSLSSVFFGALGILVSLAVGLWIDGLIRELFTRNDWLGWAAAIAAIVAALAFASVLLREGLALRRLASVENLRARASDPALLQDQSAAKALVSDLAGHVAGQPSTAAGRQRMAELRDQIVDAPDLINLAEVELLKPLDARAQRLVLDAAKRVSLVTAVSPRALVDIAYVGFETARLIRRIAELYGARPGTLGFFRLARNVLAHLAITGTMAAGDDLVGQLVGQGLAARLSARLGEGVVNGMLTARIGLAAMEAVRPLPFRAVRRPNLADFLTALASFSRASSRSDGKGRAAD